MRDNGIRSKEGDAYEQYYSLKTVATMFEISEKTIRRLIINYEISTIKIGGSIRVPKSELSKMFEPIPSKKSILNQFVFE
jgi:excisionase family DNA binding protein